MKLLQINTYLSGSTGKIAKEIHSFMGLGNSIIAYGKGGECKSKYLIKISKILFTKLDHLFSRITGITGIYSVYPTIKLIKLITKTNINIVHIHNVHGYYLNYYLLIRILRTRNIATIWTLHDEFMYTGNCGSAVPCDRWQIGCGKCPSLDEYPESLLFDWTKILLQKKRKLINSLDNAVFVTPSKWLADRAKKSILSSKDIQTISNGIDCNLFYPKCATDLKRLHNINNKKIVLAVAPDLFDGRKGGEFVLELARELIDQPIIFIMIGIPKRLKYTASNVILIKRTENQSELASYYSIADTLVICSKSENFPTVCLESLSCGTPIVGFDTGGTSETAPAKLGKFVEYGNIKLLMEATLNMINQKHIISAQCRQYALNRYSSSIMAKRYIRLYRKMIAEHD